jgi:tetratricopeptide (TPR) repeat protein
MLRVPRALSPLLVLLVTSFVFSQEAAQNQGDFPGTEDFEKASRIRVTSDSKEAYSEVIELCQSALAKGLDPVDAPAAKKMLSTTALQRAQATLEEVSGGRVQGNRMARVTNEALKDLDIAVEADPKFAEALALKGRIHVLRTELKKGLETLTQAQSALEELLQSDKDNPEIKTKLVEVLMTKALIRQDADEKIQDLMKAIEINPENERAVQQTVELLVNLGRFDQAQKAIEDFLQIAPENEYAIRRLIMLLIQEGNFQPAIDLLSKKIESFPNNSVLRGLRANVLFVQFVGDDDQQILQSALEDCEKAIELDNKNLDAILTRAKVYLTLKDLDKSKKDIELLESQRPDLPELALLRIDIAIQENRYSDAIADLERLVQANPENRGLLLRLATFYQLDKRPKNALRIADRLVKSDPTDWQAYRLRGDIQLAMGNHAQAIEEYEKAVENISKDEEDYSGVLNNLSWVLSTSPDDSVRNGNRALELALQACEMTKYKEPHILSTLAAAYAETKDFDKAKEWSVKAVELGREKGHEQLEQLEQELKSYQDGKPWREKQDVKENPNKKPAQGNGIDT